MADSTVTFTGPSGADPVTHIRYVITALTQTTLGDMLAVGQVFRSRIRQRTAAGIDASGAPFVGYSTRGPYYFYPNREAAGSVRGGSDATLHARKTAAAGRHAKTDRIGTRTPYGIRYDGGYAEAKAAHGRSTVDLYGLEQHPHMLDAMLVRAGGMEIGGGMDIATEAAGQCDHLTLGFYGTEAARAKGNNEGTSHVPARYFFALNSDDLAAGSEMLANRMEARAKAHG